MIGQSQRKSKYLIYLKSDHWKRLKLQKFLESGKKCFHCGSAKHIHVHHVNYRNLVDCTLGDLLVMCEKCHNTLHTKANRQGFSTAGLGSQEISHALRTFDPRSKSQRKRDHKVSKKQKYYDRKETHQLPPKQALKIAYLRCCNEHHCTASLKYLIEVAQRILENRTTIVQISTIFQPAPIVPIPTQVPPPSEPKPTVIYQSREYVKGPF